MESGAGEECHERLWMAEWKTNSFIHPRGIWIEFYRCIPEEAHEFHLPGVIPDIRCNGSAAGGHSLHLDESGALIRDEVQDQSRDHHVDRRVTQRNRGCTAMAKLCSSRQILLRRFEKAL